jgi:CDGSH-type Zn-finger protein
MKVKLKVGRKYSICSCGLSKILPFCDNAHRNFNSANNGEYKSIKIVSDRNVVLDIDSKLWVPNKEE